MSEKYGFVFRHPCNMIIAGPTGCGKTQFVTNILSYKMLDPFPERILVAYSEMQKSYVEWRHLFPKIDFVKDFSARIDEVYESFKPTSTNLLIIDDLMHEAGANKAVMDLFTKGSHHRNLTIIFLVQNIFCQGKSMRTISLNTQYFVLFKNARDCMQSVTLGKQMFPESANFIREVLNDVTDRDPHGYIVVDMMHGTNRFVKVRTGIFPEEDKLIYMPSGHVESVKRDDDSDDSDSDVPVVRFVQL